MIYSEAQNSCGLHDKYFTINKIMLGNRIIETDLFSSVNVRQSRYILRTFFKIRIILMYSSVYLLDT